MAVANDKAVKYAELTDEHIKDIKVAIEKFVSSNEYWDRFVHHSKVPRGHKVFTSRRLVKPKVKAEDVVARAEFVAPRPTKITVETFEKTVGNYGDKAIYSREDIQFHFDDTVNNIKDVLNEIAIQKLDFIKGTPFINSACTITYDTSILKTLRNACTILRKNDVARWDGKHYLAHLTPEEKSKLIDELEAKGVSLGEPVKIKLAGREYDLDSYGDWILSETTSPVMYKSDTVQYLVLMGKRKIDGQSPVDASKLEGESGIELINNGLGSGVLLDVDGNYTSDDNKQQGAVAINMDGLGACVSDDLCILDCEVTLNEVKGSALVESDKTGYVSHSGAELEITATAGSNTHFSYEAVRYDSTASKYYASANTIISVQVSANEGKTLGAVTAANWSAKFRKVSGGTQYNAEILACVKTSANYDTILVRVPAQAYDFAIACTATASA